MSSVDAAAYEPAGNETAWAADVRRALQSLDQDVVAALDLVYGARLTQQQTAHRLGVPLSTVRSQVLHGLQGLSAALA